MLLFNSFTVECVPEDECHEYIPEALLMEEDLQHKRCIAGMYWS